MSRLAIAVLLLSAALALPAAAGEKKVKPKLTEETKNGARITQENIVRMKIRTAQPVQTNPGGPIFGGPSSPVPPSPPGQ
jgi:hypothetical protein